MWVTCVNTSYERWKPTDHRFLHVQCMNNYHVEIVYTDQLYEMMYAIALPPLARGAESVILWRWNVLSTSQRVWAFRWLVLSSCKLQLQIGVFSLFLILAVDSIVDNCVSSSACKQTHAHCLIDHQKWREDHRLMRGTEFRTLCFGDGISFLMAAKWLRLWCSNACSSHTTSL